MEEQSAKRWRSTRRLSMGICTGLLVALVAVVSPGCLTHFGLPWKAKAENSEKTESEKMKPDASPSDQSKPEPAGGETKAASPEQTSKGSGATGETPAGKEAVPQGESPPQSRPRPAPPSPVPPDQGELASIDPEVRKAALEKAASLSAVEYMKICHKTDKDEWWVILYDNIGLFIDVKQHVWNKQTKKLERILALKQIMPSKLEANLRTNEGGRKCEVFYRPRGGSSLFAWQPVDASSARMMTKAPPQTDMAAVPAPVPPVAKPAGRKDAEETDERRSSERSTGARPKEKTEPVGRRAETRTAPPPSHESAPSRATGASRSRPAKQSPRSAEETGRPRKARDGQSTKTALHFLENWKAAWEDKDFSRFKSLYHPDFRADSLDFSQFLKRKNDFFHRYRYIRVEIDRIKVKQEGNHLEVTFLQNFRGDNYGDKGVKHMVLDVSKPQQVRILSETWSPL